MGHFAPMFKYFANVIFHLIVFVQYQENLFYVIRLLTLGFGGLVANSPELLSWCQIIVYQL